ncbi:MAG: DNA translocase FtsK [bacterium]
MKKKNNHKKEADDKGQKERLSFSFAEKTKKQIGGIIMFLLAAVVALSFFDQAGIAGQMVFRGLHLLFGNAIFFLPLILIVGGLVFFATPYKKFLWAIILGTLLLIFGIANLFAILKPGLNYGGYLGYLARPFLGLFGFWVTLIIFASVVIVGAVIFRQLISKQTKRQPRQPEQESGLDKPFESKKPSFLKRIFMPTFKVEEIEEAQKQKEPKQEILQRVQAKEKETASIRDEAKYELPPLDLLDGDKGSPTPGDIRVNSAIIKKTLENFSIPVEMSQVNIGPTVTQYTLKPADGIKLSKITTLANDLSLALASHPIRIEAPIPGKSLVGIELPNKVRAQVRLRDLIASLQFQNSSANLNLCLGRDVSGSPIYADLAKMPHFLVAGSTGSGKTIFLNSIIISLLYRNSPEKLRFILIDPKRVEFPVYNELPHLLCPVILDSQKTINVLKWLISEMERRFEVLSSERTRDIIGYNELAQKNKKQPLPYIVTIIDELADLMMARGKEVEAYVVRLAQMARAVGIHLVVATQRPSVEVITGLIKANITARVTFQVASQVDSRTILDMAGAEKLLGLGDLLFISAEVAKPKRIQGAYLSEKEVKRVVEFIASNFKAKMERVEIDGSVLENDGLMDNLTQALEMPPAKEGDFSTGDDPIYEQARKLVIEAKRASASLLQRRLRIGYARAARLIDIMEEKGVVGPAEGAKPRVVFVSAEQVLPDGDHNDNNDGNNDGWHKI